MQRQKYTHSYLDNDVASEVNQWDFSSQLQVTRTVPRINQGAFTRLKHTLPVTIPLHFSGDQAPKIGMFHLKKHPQVGFELPTVRS